MNMKDTLFLIAVLLNMFAVIFYLYVIPTCFVGKTWTNLETNWVAKSVSDHIVMYCEQHNDF